jgi:hypothetical protein
LFTNHVGRWFVLLSPSSNSHHSLWVYLVLRAVSLIGKERLSLIIIGISVLAVCADNCSLDHRMLFPENLIRNYAPDESFTSLMLSITYDSSYWGHCNSTFSVWRTAGTWRADEVWSWSPVHMEEMFDRTMTTAEACLSRQYLTPKRRVRGELTWLFFEKQYLRTRRRRDWHGWVQMLLVWVLDDTKSWNPFT